MSKTFFKVALLSALLSSLSLADDFLAKVSNGALSDNSTGVKKLTLDEASQVVGGYYVRFKDNETKWGLADTIYAIAMPDLGNELGWAFVNGELDLQQTMKNEKGLCPMGITECYSNKNARKHMWQSQKRLQEFNQALDGANYLYTGLAYSVRRHIGYSRNGRFVYFTYGVATYNRLNGQMRNVTSSAVLNGNLIIKELSKAYKEQMENRLGGWNVRAWDK